VRIVVAEDGGLFHQFLVESLPQHGTATDPVEVVGRARTTTHLLELVGTATPDVVTLDLAMPRLLPPADPAAGLDAAREIRRDHPGVGIVVLSNIADLSFVEAVLALGSGVGYQLKDRVENMAELVGILRTVAAGGVRVDETLVAALITRPRVNDPLAGLSRRELHILTLMAKGLSNAAIATELNYSVKVIEETVSTVYRKLDIDPDEGINKRVLAVLAFLRWGRPGDHRENPSRTPGAAR
jgi:DNA-binding NarL/FixJ family response regulator